MKRSEALGEGEGLEFGEGQESEPTGGGGGLKTIQCILARSDYVIEIPEIGKFTHFFGT